MPSDHPRRAAVTLDRERDVARARAAVDNTEVRTGRRPSSRGTTASRASAAWHDFTARYGWRAYALPVLLLITIVALLTANNGSATQPPAGQPSAGRAAAASGAPSGAQTRASTAPPSVHSPASASTVLKTDAAAQRSKHAALNAAALPAGGAYTQQGAGTFRVLKGMSRTFGAGPLHRFSLEVENGVRPTEVADFARLVMATLSDRRSWSGHGVSLRRVDSGRIDFRVSLTSAYTTRKLCGYTIHVETSCYADVSQGRTPVNRVVLNVARWMRGSTAYLRDLPAYRMYMINHEDGHALGHLHAHQCLPGGLAPVMMQQTFGLRSAATGAMCRANPWPFPPGVHLAPGAEQPDTPANDEYGLSD